VVCAAGNADNDRPFWPAADYRFVSVAALDPQSGGKARFSNYGSRVRACASGVRVHSSYPTYEASWPAQVAMRWTSTAGPSGDGASFAASHVAGRIAAIMTEQGIGSPEAVSRLFAASDHDPLLGARID
jgi:hypothetical protein